MKKVFSILIVTFAIAAMVGCGKKDNDNSIDSGWVDLGLPSGTLWAKCNLGADSPEGYGDYLAWGETQGKNIYDWSTYRYCTAEGDSLLTLTKYNTSETYGTVDGLTTLQIMDDAAAVRLSGTRMPTREDWEELLASTVAEWVTQNGVAGYRLTASNGNSLFLPAAGSSNGTELVAAGVFGFYWSASLYTDSPDDAWSFSFLSGADSIGSFGYRSDGQSIRPVKNK
jgi:predicted secreted protein